jgi:hypothetical protein
MSIKFVKEGQAGFHYRGANMAVQKQPVYFMRFVVEGKKNGVFPATINQFVYNKLKVFPKRTEFIYAINAYFPKIGKNAWRMGSWDEWNKVECVNVMIRDSVGADNMKIKMFDVFFRKPSSKVAGAEEVKNDCVYNAVLKALNGDVSKMPRHLRKKSDFKKFFQVDRNDPIPLSKIPLLQNEFKNTSLSICGDYIYMPAEVLPKHFTFRCSGEHITTACNKGRTSTANVQFKNYPIHKIVTIKHKNEKLEYFDGEFHKMDYEEYLFLKNNKEHLFIFCEPTADLKDKRKEYLEKAQMLLDASNGVINYFRTSTDRLVALESWRMLSKNVADPDELSSFEQYALDVAYRGGVHHTTVGTFNDCVDLDMNSMYAFYMKSKSFYIPVKTPKLSIIEAKDWEDILSKKFFPFGLFHCVLNGNHALFDTRLNGKKSWFTHYDLTIFSDMDVSIELVHDKSANALLYDTKSRITGKDMFGTWVDFMFNLKEEGHDVKCLLSTLHGAMCKKNVEKHRVNTAKHESLDVTGKFVEGIEHSGDVDIIETVDSVHIFQYKYARVGPFLTSYCRMKILQLLLKTVKKVSDIHYINTDGFIIPKTYLNKFPISTNIGDFKIAKNADGTERIGDVVIKNHRSIEFSP